MEALTGLNAIFYTPPIINSPRQIEDDIQRLRDRLKRLAFEPLRQEEDQQLRRINQRDKENAAEAFVTHDWLSSPMPKCKPTYAEVAEVYRTKEKELGEPTKLILVDEADRLKITSLEQLRAIFDQGNLGLVLIGMPGLEKRLARYAQFYSRIGFVHEFRPLSSAEMRQLLAQGWKPAGVTFPTISTLAAGTHRYSVGTETARFRATSRGGIPPASNCLADSIFPVVILRGRPPIRPSFLAAPSPARVRSTISSRSICARLAMTWKKNRPAGVLVSIPSVRLLK
jgi:hypothetical protein